nr:hypothetical protein [Tanacetum cinerariifolium]
RKHTQESEVPPIESPAEHNVPLPSPSFDLLPGGEDSLKLKELIDLYTNLSNKVLDLESEVAGSCCHMGSKDTGNSTHMSDKNIISKLPNKNTIADLFGLSLLSIEDIDVLTRKIEVKIHDVSLQEFLEDGISLIASQFGKPIVLDSFTSSMCIESWGRSSFAYYLIKVKADEALKDSITLGIRLPKDMGFTKEIVHIDTNGDHLVMKNVRFDPKAHGNSQTANDGPNSVHLSSKEKPIKDANLTSFSYTRSSLMKGDLYYPTSTSNIPTSNPYDALDDMESDKEVEVVFDETINSLDNNIMKAKNMAPDASKN